MTPVIEKCRPWGPWVAQSVEHPTSALVMISQFLSSSPASGSVRTAWSLEPASDSVSPSLSAPPLLVLCLSLSFKMNKHGVPGWLNRLCLTLAQVMISWFRGLSPMLGSILTAQHLKPASDSVSASLSAPSLLTFCLSLTQINTHYKIFFKALPDT